MGTVGRALVGAAALNLPNLLADGDERVAEAVQLRLRGGAPSQVVQGVSPYPVSHLHLILHPVNDRRSTYAGP
jgi:hypothetical protein